MVYSMWKSYFGYAIPRGGKQESGPVIKPGAAKSQLLYCVANCGGDNHKLKTEALPWLRQLLLRRSTLKDFLLDQQHSSINDHDHD